MSYDVTFHVDPTTSRTGQALVEKRDTSAGNGGPKASPQLPALARGLGWFSLALGLGELLAPRQISRAIGVREEHATLVTLLGLRELVSGLGILTRQDQTNAWMKSRVLGDVIDLSLLGAAFGTRKRDPVKLVFATAAVAGVTALDVLCAVRGARATREDLREITHSIAVQKPIEELYDSMHKLGDLPRAFPHLESVQVRADGRSHFRMKPLAGKRYEWDVEISDAVRPERFSFRCVHGDSIEHCGDVAFQKLGEGRGTLVTIQLFSSPALRRASAVGLSVALGHELKAGLRRWKQWLETGEVATTEGQPTGERTMLGRILP